MKKIVFHVTETQRKSVRQLQSQIDISLSQLLRDLVGMACVQRGIDWVDDMRTHGGDRYSDDHREALLRKAQFLEDVMDIDEAVEALAEKRKNEPPF